LPPSRCFHLSPRVAAVLDDTAAPLALDGVFADELRQIRARFEAPGGRVVELADLALGELEVLRAIARKIGLVEERAARVECSNCGGVTRVRPCDGLELGPFLHGELADPELDVPFDFAEAYPIDGLGRVRLSRLTVRGAAPLFEALQRPQGLRITSGVARALGVAAVDEVDDPRRIARRLRHASADALDAFTALFENAHYGPRLITIHLCPTCGTALECPAPAERELSLPAVDDAIGASRARSDEAFADLDAFEALAWQVADRVLGKTVLHDVDLVVEGGPAATDAGGSPLLGSYLPPSPDGQIALRAEIALYHRTFENQWRFDGPYDLEAEIEDTLRHELEHHVAHLDGDDPMDRDERAAIEQEARQRIGPTEARRRTTRDAVRGGREFLRATWWIWVIAALGVAAMMGGR
jgi:hypothetical protein